MTENQISPVKNEFEILSPLVQDYLNAIRTALHKTVDGIFEAAELCAKADKELDDTFGSRAQLIDHLPISEAQFSKFVSLAKDPKFKDPNVRRCLPLSFSTIDEIRKTDRHAVQPRD